MRGKCERAWAPARRPRRVEHVQGGGGRLVTPSCYACARVREDELTRTPPAAAPSRPQAPSREIARWGWVLAPLRACARVRAREGAHRPGPRDRPRSGVPTKTERPRGRAGRSPACMVGGRSETLMDRCLVGSCQTDVRSERVLRRPRRVRLRLSERASVGGSHVSGSSGGMPHAQIAALLYRRQLSLRR